MEPKNKPGYSVLRRGRHSQPNGIYFITVVTNDRIPWFQDFELACLISRNLEQPKSLGDAKNLCWVVMPDHLHCLLQIGETPLNRVMNRFNSRTARMLNRAIGRAGRFWAPGYHDHALRKEERLMDTARYIVANPIRASLVTKAGHYPFWNAIWL